MKKLFTYLFLIFLSFQTFSFSEDVEDLEINGVSIGESLLDYLSKEEIVNEIKSNKPTYNYLNNDFGEVYLRLSSDNYEYMSVFVKPNDKNYIIGSLEGMIIYENQIEKCHKKQQEIIYELDNLFKYTKKKEWDKTHAAEKNSTTKAKQYTFENGDIVAVICYDWSENNKYKFVDKLGVSIKTKEFQNWINNEAY